jgi:hypothetical protein
MAPLCSKCGKNATITLYVIEGGIEKPNVELCEECYRTIPLSGSSGLADPTNKNRQVGVSYRFRYGDPPEKPPDTADKSP